MTNPNQDNSSLKQPSPYKDYPTIATTDTADSEEVSEPIPEEAMGIIPEIEEPGSDESGSDESGSDESGSDESGSDESGSNGLEIEVEFTEMPDTPPSKTPIAPLPLIIDRDSLPPSTVKAHLVLVGSGSDDSLSLNYGLIEDIQFKPDWEPGKGQVVGTWNRMPNNNTIHIELANPIEAINDRAIIIMRQILEGKKSGAIRAARSTSSTPKTPKAPKAQKELPIPEPPSKPSVLEGFESLRAKLAALRAKK